MATQDDEAGQTIDRLSENLRRVEELSQRLVAALSQRNPSNPTLNGPGPEIFAKAGQAYWEHLLENPARIFETQMQYWGESVRHFAQAQEMLLKSCSDAVSDAPAETDKRFAHPMWQKNPFFHLLKEQYQTNAKAIKDAVAGVDTLDAGERRRLSYFTDQIVDMMAPTNFLGTNPEVLERAVETEGESLVRGLENLVADLEANNGEMVVRLADETAFKLGENIATTPGQVVYRNRMMELIQYNAVTEDVYEIPLVIFPPWINKFYILDLKPQNSLIKWATEQGYTVFVVSWLNPTLADGDLGLENYIEDGFLQAISEAKAITGQDKVNAVGYCIAGTTLSMTLALMKARGDKSVRSATFFTALTDFSDQGEFTPFLQNDFIDGIEEEVTQQGILRAFIMARTFSYLRSRDLIYTPAIRSYMMGEAPPAFDLLYWNGDGANLPAKMSMQYLRGLCQRNEFADGGFEICGERLHLKDVDVPLMAITCETDHIAAWKDCYRGVQQMGSRSKIFVVSESGHIAGIVNPPTKNKYGHYVNEDLSLSADDWLKGSDFTEGSWWPRWDAWLKRRSGKKIGARGVGDASHKPIAPAPGTYVTRKALER